MSTSTLPWPDLSAYKLLLTVTHDKSGNRALIIRADDPEEAPEKTKARVEALAPKIEKVCQRIGESQIRSRALRDQYIVFTGPMVKNQALVNRFFGRLFPKSTTVDLTLADAESAEVVRNIAKAHFNQNKVGPDTLLDTDKLIEALPSGLNVEVTDNLLLRLPNDAVIPVLVNQNTTNREAVALFEPHLRDYFANFNMADVDLIDDRQASIARQESVGNLGYFEQAFLDIEKDYLTTAKADLEQAQADREKAEADKENQETAMGRLINLRDDLQRQLDNQGMVVDGRLLSRLNQVKDEIAKFEADLVPGETEKDNVQESVPEEEGPEVAFDAEGYREIGKTVEGDTLYEDENGVRSKLSGAFRVSEKVALIPTRSGLQSQVGPRDEGWLTVEEALDEAPAALTYEATVRAAFMTRVTETDAHYWKAVSLNYEGESQRFLIRARERGNPAGELELINLEPAEVGYHTHSQRLSPVNELISGSTPYMAPKVLADLWVDAGFHLSDKGVQTSTTNAQSDDERANVEEVQPTSEVDDATDQSKSEQTDAGNEADGAGVPTTVGGTDGVSEQPGTGSGSAGATDSDLLEQREQSGPTGQPGTEPGSESELAGGDRRTEGAGAVGGSEVDAGGTSEHGAGGGSGLGDGFGNPEERAGEGASLSDPAQTAAGQRSADGDNRTATGRDGQPDPDAVRQPGGGDLFGDDGDSPENADASDGASEGAGSPEPNGVTGNADDSGAAIGSPVGDTVSAGAGSTPGQGESGDPSADSVGDGSEDAGDRADGEPDSELLGDTESFEDFAGPERFHAPSDENPRSATERLKDNIAAIMRLSEFKDGTSTPSMEDREVLAGFSGFGGIHASLFGWGGPDWVNSANQQIRALTSDGAITSQEYSSIRSTILNAHYTHSGIIEPMWEALDKFNIPLDRTLEPSSGTFQFKSFMPEALESKVKQFTGIEIDPLTARMAQAVHPDAKVINSGFEKTSFPDNFFDCAISNIPFGDYKVFDPEHPERKSSIHNQFFLKGLDKVRPGGVVAFLTSSYVLDSKDDSIRREIDDKAHVVGTYRLPSGTFQKSTGTEVVTDILFLQKKGDFEPNYEPLNIVETTNIEAPLGTASAMFLGDDEYNPGDMVPNQRINKVYADHPDRVLGELAVMSSQFGPALRVLGGGTISEQRETLRSAFEGLPSNLPANAPQTITPDDIDQFDSNTNNEAVEAGSLPGALFLNGTKVLQKTLGAKGEVTDVTWEPPKSMHKRVVATIQAMTSLSVLMELETTARTEEENAQLSEARDRAKLDADNLVALSNGKKPLAGATLKVMAGDSRFKLLQGAITVDNDLQWSLADIYSHRTVQASVDTPRQADNISDALAISLAYTATISETYMAQLLSHKEPAPTDSDIRQQLVDAELAYIDPVNNQMVESSVYLSDNLRPKITAVENIIESAPEFQKNLDALNAALPAPLKPSEIKVSADAFWLPTDVMEDFLSEGLGITTTGQFGVKPFFDEHKRHWRLEPSATTSAPSMRRIAEQQEHVAKSRFGTPRRNVFELLDNVFTSTIPQVKDPIPGTKPTKYVVNAQESLKAQGKADELLDTFGRWLFKSPARAQRLADIYNERINTWVLNEPDGSHMVYPGMAENFIPRKHQNDFIWRAVSGKNAMTAHVVGAGKTMQLIGVAIRGKQMGRWNKPLVVVPNHMLEQFTNDGHEIYPGAKILAMTAADARADNRAAFAARCAMGNWDMVVCTHSVFEKITVPQDFEAKLIEDEVRKLRASLDAAEDDKKPKEVEKAVKRLEDQLERTLSDINDNKENILNLKQIGVDFIGVDEAHYFKNLMVDTSSQIPGVSNASSKRAMNMLLKSQYMNEIHDGPYGVMMATGTPISNSVTECYTFMRMMRPDLLESAGIQNFNDWMGLFGEVKHGMELKPEGGGYQMKSRLSRFKNIPELVKMVRSFIDVKTREDLQLPTPNVVTEHIAAPQSPTMKLFMKYIEARAKDVRAAKEGGGGPAAKIATQIREALNRANDKTTLNKDTGELDPDADLELADDILLTIATDGRKASLDMRLIHPDFEDDPNSKVNQCVRKCVELYQKFDDDKAAQMIFCDFSSPTGKGIFNVYDDIKAKLIKAGVAESEVAFIHDAKNDADKEALFAKVRSGEVRFILGSTQKMGVGTNVQERLIALHQLDPPWKPADIEQRLGRMDRQGNMFKETYNFIWNQEDSFDLFMWETLNRKLKMIQQAMRKPEDCSREINEETEAGYEDILAITTGNPAIKEFLEARNEMERLKRMSDSHTDQQADLAGQIHIAERKAENIEAYLTAKKEEQALVNDNLPLHIEFDGPAPELRDGPMCTAGGLDGLTEAIKHACQRAPAYRTVDIGTFGGLTIKASRLAQEPVLMIERLAGNDERIHMFTPQKELLTTEVDQKTGEIKKSDDDNRTAAKALARYVHKIATDNGIKGTEEALSAAKKNLENLKSDLGTPFEYEDELLEVRKKHDELAELLGDEIDSEKQLDPQPLVDFAEMINEQTGQHGDLAFHARQHALESGSDAMRDHLARIEGEMDSDDMGASMDDDNEDSETPITLG